MTTITKQLYNSGGRETPVSRLVAEIEREAGERGLTLSRWQANGQAHMVNITYAVHYGERAGQYRYMAPESVIAAARLTQLEGTTERSEAHRKLSAMLTQVRAK